jgi:hypothetical protein
MKLGVLIDEIFGKGYFTKPHKATQRTTKNHEGSQKKNTNPSVSTSHSVGRGKTKHQMTKSKNQTSPQT